ncbi:hypothetical protein [Clostridium sp. YIM B02551]|uniref:hypothetical protein n=1 Tax=Clostridium sp. YIM B02551 TaxID=2910679 RepID=UPI001EEC4C61|nr:hypothetical protein [Clostridium sp. YIM B02551]
MEYTIGEYERDGMSLHDKCKKYMNYHAVLKMKDGKMVDGIIVGMDEDNIIMLIPEDVMEEYNDDDNYGQHRQFGGFGHGGPGRFRRFGNRSFPFATLAALSLFRYPYYYQYPYYYPYYPYYYQYYTY